MTNRDDTERLLDLMEAIRTRNNPRHMGFIRLAFKHAPVEAAALARGIEEDDKAISEIFAELGESERILGPVNDPGDESPPRGPAKT